MKSITAKDLMKPEAATKLKKATEAQDKFASDGATLASHMVNNECYCTVQKYKYLHNQ